MRCNNNGHLVDVIDAILHCRVIIPVGAFFIRLNRRRVAILSSSRSLFFHISATHQFNGHFKTFLLGDAMAHLQKMQTVVPV